ncbi:MAG: exo-alpha-sialidase [Xanthomonadales bacterium]|nr:exo-alpha-sialidase [Xanthomonadales bacterium]
MRWSTLWCIAATAMLASAAVVARVGDDFRTVRGDDDPGGSWHALTMTNSGRLIAVGGGGGLMVSDNSGVDWDFRRVIVDGKPERISFSDIVEFGPNSGMGQRRLAAIGVWLEPDISDSWPFAGRTYIYLSSDNGDNWSKHPFPEVSTTHTTYGLFDGVTLQRLFVTNDGRLLAYGTTMVSNLFVTWSVGGLIYRSNDGINWTRSIFERGPIQEMAYSASIGRLVAAGFGTMLDSADGAGWNGYQMKDAAVTVPAGPLSYETLRKLSVEDIVIHDDHYVATAITYVPYDDSISTSIPDKIYNLDAAAPFGPGRDWTGREQPSRFGKLFSDGTSLAQIGLRGVYTSGNNGQSWSRPVTDPVASGRAFTQTPSGDFFGIGKSSTSNNGLAVWHGTSLTTWSKVFDRPKLPFFAYALGTSGEHAFVCGTASGSSGSINSIYGSSDNGETWTQRATGLPGCVGKLVRHGSRLLVPDFDGGVNISDDNGASWQNLRVLPDGHEGATALTRTRTGRLILGPEGRVSSSCYVSDDGGDTWSPRPWPAQFGEDIIDIKGVGGSRVIALAQYFASFDPRLLISDDDGETWRRDESLESVAGLPQSGGSLIEMEQIVQSPSGRIFIRGDDALIVSDDNGSTWQYRFGTFFTNGLRAGPWWGDIHDMAYVNKRWVMPMTLRETNEVIDHKRNWMLVSDDDGDTWFRREIPSNFALAHDAMMGEHRAIVIGSDGAVWLSDAEHEVEAASERVLVRAGEIARINIPRPPIPGNLDMVYSTMPDLDAPGGENAVIGYHYDETAGALSWANGDNSPRVVEVQTYNHQTDTEQPMKRFLVQLVPEGADMDSAVQIPVSIMNTGRPINSVRLQLMDMDNLVFSIGGDAKDFHIALGRQPDSDVNLLINLGEPAMASVSPTVLTFTNANWHEAQSIAVTPVGGNAPVQPHLGTSYEILITADTQDPAYSNHLGVAKALYRYPSPLIFYDGVETDVID